MVGDRWWHDVTNQLCRELHHSSSRHVASSPKVFDCASTSAFVRTRSPCLPRVPRSFRAALQRDLRRGLLGHLDLLRGERPARHSIQWHRLNLVFTVFAIGSDRKNAVKLSWVQYWFSPTLLKSPVSPRDAWKLSISQILNQKTPKQISGE